MARKSAAVPIIVRRHILAHDEEEHNGTWKLAYADFVTAMMAFFLVMWLLNITTVEQRKGIADYFNPVAVSQSNSGADGMLAGRSVDSRGSLTTPNADGNEASPVASPPVVASVGDSDRAPAGRKDPMPHPEGARTPPREPGSAVDLLGAAGAAAAPAPAAAAGGQPAAVVTRAELEALLDHRSAAIHEQAALDRLERELRERVAASPDLSALAGGVLVQQVPEGLRVQLTDQTRASLFQVGSARMNEAGQRLMGLIASALAGVANPVTITGHTDGLAYADASRYGNWELSSDRANAARRALIAGGIPGNRIVRVEGRADLDHLVPDSPLDPGNRRISITLLRRPPD
ncbi:flagellar motor protein MotB [Azospirillum halopraeferens]|uniref:flagellar motor protein MotB n=1 Tax=Azospirillum halopraeferens TaxID=34010 RepID=UPI000401BEC2|nr:flagellar motor protein MotB [Azospirillum halopraeferens]